VVAVLSAGEARHVQLFAQGLVGSQRSRSTVGILAQVGAVQLDTISVLARSHELVVYARRGPIGRKAAEAMLWSGENFEYWAHAACVVPLSDWPLFAPRRAVWRERIDQSSIPDSVFKEVRARLADGPATANQLGGAKAGGPWWDWTHTKRAVEALLGAGEVVCMSRKGFQRVYELAEDRVPEALVATALPTTECHRRLVAAAGRHLGVATVADLADYYRLIGRQVEAVVRDTGLVPAEVKGWKQKAWAHPDALGVLDSTGRIQHVTTLLSPFDSLVWDRSRTERVFGFTHRLEAYVPEAKRIHGYYSMPLLAGGRLVGRVDPARRDGALVARKVTLGSESAAGAVAKALVGTAAWIGSDTVIVEQVDPPGASRAIKSALKSALG
jgi:uncharacterized protein